LITSSGGSHSRSRRRFERRPPSTQAELARKNGFATEMHFVATDSIAENVARVLQRAQAGGHAA
jgi:predicted ABC-type ATPase